MQIRPMFVGKDKKRVQQSAEVASLEFIFGIQICRYFFEGSLMNAILLFGISQHPSFMQKAEISHIYHMLPDHTLQHTHLS